MNRDGWRAIAALLGLAVLAGAFSSPLMADPPSFRGVDDLAGLDVDDVVTGLSGDGYTLVGYASAGVEHEAFCWSDDLLSQELGDLVGGDMFSEAAAASRDGSVVVGASSSVSGDEAFLWTAAGGMKGLGDLEGGAFASRASGVSGDGRCVVGVSASARGEEAFRWTAAGGMVALGRLHEPGIGSAKAASSNGDVVVGYSIDLVTLETVAFRWSAGNRMTALPDFPGGDLYSVAHDVSTDGATIVGVGTESDLTLQACLWRTTGDPIDLGLLPGWSQSVARAVSGDGTAVVGYGVFDSGASEAFYWSETTGLVSLQDLLEDDCGLDLTGWVLTAAHDVSEDGRTICGRGLHDGQAESFVAHLGSDPDALTLDVDASCPSGGTIHVSWRGATPGGRIAMLFSSLTGEFVVPDGQPCAGAILGLASNLLTVVFRGDAGADGSGSIEEYAPPIACGGWLQLLDLDACTPSNIAEVR